MPKRNAQSFNCPHCHAFAKQVWFGADRYIPSQDAQHINLSKCDHCDKLAVWRDSDLIDPAALSAAEAHADMPDDIRRDYEEARKVLNPSPRSSAALLRLCVQKLCIELGEPGKNINADIGDLVAKGLSPHIQQALDIVRVVGNEQVHPGVLDVRDNPEVAGMLFTLVNLIVDDKISKPKAIAKMYAQLPSDKLKGISDRDSKKK